jgi:type I restriction enzyme M protein
MSDFESIFNELSRTNDRSIIWNNWLDYCININLMQKHSRHINQNFYGNEERYFEMFTEWIKELNTKLSNNNYYDLIGQLYEENVQSKGKQKDFQQYYTPIHVTELMTDLAIPTALPEGSFANDCCCGSGRFLLAIYVKNKGGVYCIGQDLDETSCKMTALNFYSHGIQGSVLHMDTLEGTFYKGWRVNRWLYDGICIPHIEEIDNVNDAFGFFGANKSNVVEVNDHVENETVQTTLV